MSLTPARGLAIFPFRPRLSAVPSLCHARSIAATARHRAFQISGVGCSHWSRCCRRSLTHDSKVSSDEQHVSIPTATQQDPNHQNQVGFMEDAEEDIDIDLDGIHIDHVADESQQDDMSNAERRRPKLPTSMKKLNKALGRKYMIELPDQDLIETFVRGRGPGGQAINKTNSSVSLVHVPTGIRIQSQPTRSREQNRIAARHILSEKLDELRAKGIWPVTLSDSKQNVASALVESAPPWNDKQQRRESKKQQSKDLADAYTKSELRAAKERARKLNRAKKHKKKKRKMAEDSEAEASAE